MWKVPCLRSVFYFPFLFSPLFFSFSANLILPQMGIRFFLSVRSYGIVFLRLPFSPRTKEGGFVLVTFVF